jgi:hypothetical protein
MNELKVFSFHLHSSLHRIVSSLFDNIMLFHDND